LGKYGKQSGLRFFRNADPCVDDFERNKGRNATVKFKGRFDCDAASFGKFDGISEQIQEYLPQFCRITDEVLITFWLKIKINAKTFFNPDPSRDEVCLFNQTSQIEWYGFQLNLTRFDFREI